MPRWLRNSRSGFVRLTAATTLVAFLAATLGVPLSSADTGKDLSAPFPCMHRQCGCRSAQQCWQSCCCFTNREKVAWAKEHGVTLPDYVATAAEREADSTSTPNKPTCCAAKGSAKSAAAMNDDKKGSCAAPRDKQEAAQVRSEASGLQVISIAEALACQGHAEQWVAMGAIDVPPVALWQFHLLASATLAIFSESCDSLAAAPAAPPPRR